MRKLFLFLSLGISLLASTLLAETQSFSLIDHTGHAFTQDNLQGKVSIMNFIFTRCRNKKMCPAATQRMHSLQQLVNQKGLSDKVQFISISFDPDYDTPEKLIHYGKAHGLDFANYKLLTGDLPTIQQLKRNFRIFTVGNNENIEHTMNTVIFNQNGNIVFGKAGHLWNEEDFFKEIKKILKI